ncbi:MAG TPA: hypothetical protein PKH10_03770 [bacterium]|nr:hypothetical protein [bacterium]
MSAVNISSVAGCPVPLGAGDASVPGAGSKMPSSRSSATNSVSSASGASPRSSRSSVAPAASFSS